MIVAPRSAAEVSGIASLSTERIALTEDRSLDLIALDQALDRLEARDSGLAELIEMRVLGGMENKDIAEVLGVSRRIVERDVRAATLFLLGEVRGVSGDADERRRPRS